MDESSQQIIALILVAIVVILEVVRRYRRKTSGKHGCDGCDTGTATSGDNEIPLKPYKRRK